MILSQSEIAQVANIAKGNCEQQARRYGGNADEGVGPVFQKVVENLDAKSQLDKPLEHFANATASLEARRFFLRAKECRPIQKSGGSDSKWTLDSHSSGRNPGDAPGPKGKVGRWHSLHDFNDPPGSEASDVLALLIAQEDAVTAEATVAEVRCLLCQLPSEWREALLVCSSAQKFDQSGAELPKSVRELSKKNGCSRQHIYDLAERAKRFLQEHLRQGDYGDAD